MTIIQPSSRDLHSRARRAGYDPAALDAAIAIVGVGAIGQNTALNLALSGILETRVIDADRFEPHNLTRSPLFPPSARGRDGELPKAPLCANVLAQLATHPDALVRYADAWVEDLGAAAFDGVAAVVCCVDSLRARAYLADRCRQLSLPMIEAGFGGADITIGVYPPTTDTACWRCGKIIHDEVVSCRLAAATAERLGIVPAIQTAAAVAGGIQAEAVIQVLHGHFGDAQRVWLNIRTGEAITAELPPDPDCRHRAQPPVIESDLVAGSAARALLEAAAEHLDGPIEIELPSPYLTRATCGACAITVDVNQPGHRYIRNPRCTECGGLWTRAPGTTSENGETYINQDNPLAELSCAALGLAPGDIIIAGSPTGEIALKLRGGPEDLFKTI